MPSTNTSVRVETASKGRLLEDLEEARHMANKSSFRDIEIFTRALYDRSKRVPPHLDDITPVPFDITHIGVTDESRDARRRIERHIADARDRDGMTYTPRLMYFLDAICERLFPCSSVCFRYRSLTPVANSREARILAHTFANIAGWYIWSGSGTNTRWLGFDDCDLDCFDPTTYHHDHGEAQRIGTR